MEIMIPKINSNGASSRGSKFNRIERIFTQDRTMVHSVSHGAPDFCRCRKFNEPRTNISGSVTTHSRKQTAHAKSCIPRDGGGCFVPRIQREPRRS